MNKCIKADIQSKTVPGIRRMAKKKKKNCSFCKYLSITFYATGTLLERHRAHRENKPWPSDLENQTSWDKKKKKGKQTCANAIKALSKTKHLLKVNIYLLNYIRFVALHFWSKWTFSSTEYTLSLSNFLK